MNEKDITELERQLKAQYFAPSPKWNRYIIAVFHIVDNGWCTPLEEELLIFMN